MTVLVENLYDALLAGDERTQRTPFGVGRAAAPQFEDGSAAVGLVAEHGFAALVTVRRGTTTTSLLFDAGMSPDALVTNADRLGVDHLSGPAFEPVITPTVDALTALDPALVTPGHCTGWRAQHAVAAALPGAWVQPSCGTTVTLAAS